MNMCSLVFELFFVYRTHACEEEAILLHASLGRHWNENIQLHANNYV